MPFRVVIAEDEPLIGMQMRQQVEAKGYQVVGTASTGTQALDLCLQHCPSVRRPPALGVRVSAQNSASGAAQAP
jgi:chemotaxis response regulator CheB